MVEIPALLPWQQEAWSNIWNSFARFPHATLLTGIEGIGKFQFASRLAMKLLCDADGQHPCGECRGCRLFAATTHPDLHSITSEAKLDSIGSTMSAYSERYLEDSRVRSKRKTVRTTILISQIRSLIEQVNIASHISRNKIFLISPVDAMTISASNSLLKVLEEPADNNFLILITENAQHLLPTIASRCQKIRMPEPSLHEAQQWLEGQGLSETDVKAITSSQNGPILGLQKFRGNALADSIEFVRAVIKLLTSSHTEDMLSVLDVSVELGVNESLLMLHQLTYNLIKTNMSPESNTVFNNVDLKPVSQGLNKKELYYLYDHIGRLRQEMTDGSLDKNLAIEDVLLPFGNICKSKTTSNY